MRKKKNRGGLVGSPIRVVGVGSSAGGIAALRSLLRGLPVDLPNAYVVAQHMSPDQDSHLVELLARETELPVVFAVDGLELAAGRIVVAQANCDIRVEGGRVQVVSPGAAPGPSPSIDALFNSLADSWGPNAVGVILSGTGSDGVQGAESIRAAGGFVVVEQPATADFGAMPQAAIDSGAAEVVLDPAEVGAELHRLAGPAGTARAAVSTPAEIGGDEVQEIISGVQAATGIDFSEYKHSTVDRQIARRQALTGAKDLADYRARALADPLELKALAAALLVTVTSFFRDPEAWTALGARLSQMPAWGGTGPSLRIWVPGCATGEEAYTAGMVAAEALGNPDDLCAQLKIFATDLNESSLEIARCGRYTGAAVAPIPDRFRKRWLRPDNGGWEVESRLRECVVFARHNVAFDPPFPNLGLICLRNTMIYLQPKLRNRVLRLCHFALTSDGLLMLGASERLDSNDRLFVPEDSAHHLYRRSGTSSQEMLPALGTQQLSDRSVPVESTSRREVAALQDLLISRLIPAGLVVDGGDCVVRVIGDVTPWCALAEGHHSSKVTELLRKPLRRPVSGLLGRVRRMGSETAQADVAIDDAMVRCRVVRLGTGNDATVAVFLEAISTGVAAGGFDDAPGPDQAAEVGEQASSPHPQPISPTQVLETTIDDLDDANERLQVLNEELQASSEELQAASEELQAANEELAASNEELATMNAELQIRADLVAQANTDLNSIQSSLTSGMVIVDRDSTVIRYTPLAVRLFSLIESDIGAPLTAVPTSLRIDGLDELLRAAIFDSATGMREVHGDEVDFLLSCQPYVDLEGRVIGAIVVTTDISEMSAARREAARLLRDREAITGALQEAVWLETESGALQLPNRRAMELFGLDELADEVDVSTMLAAVHPDDRAEVAASWARRTAHAGSYRVVAGDGSHRWIDEAMQSIQPGNGTPRVIIRTALDVTERVEAAAALNCRDAVFEALFNSPLASILLLDDEGRIVRANECFDAMLGYPAGSLVGTHLEMLITGPQRPADRPGAGRSEALAVGIGEYLLTAADGSKRHVSMSSSQSIVGCQAANAVVIHDATGDRSLVGELAVQVQFDPQTGAMTRAHFREQLQAELANAQGAEGSVAVLWVDLDDFKAINDQYGHEVGDVVLRESLSRLRSVTRAANHIGRVGGDEFVITVKDIDVRDNLELATDRVLGTFSEPIPASDWMIYVSGSVGVAISPDDGATADQLLHNADTAMYVAKRAGGNQRAYFRAEMNRAAGARATMRQELAVAVRQRDFEMFYQPIVSTDDLKVTAVEALLRWRRDGALVPAEQFVAAAGETSQMRAIGRQVLLMVDADMRRFARGGLIELPISINFSAAELEDRALIDALLAWQPVGGFARVLIEVTESSQLAHAGKAAETLRLMMRLGARVAVDDFGTGYSNLEALERMRPSVVKIDRSMLIGVHQHKRGRKVLAAAVQLAHALGARVVIEGVETVDQHELASELGAEEVQGNLFAEPMAADQLLVWLGAWRPGECGALLAGEGGSDK